MDLLVGMLIYLVVMGLQRCRQAARLFQAVQTPWLAAASCSVGKLPAGVGSAAQRQACHYAAAAADPLETQQVAGGGARCGPGSDTGLAQTQQQPTSIPCRDRLEWSTSTFDRCRLSSSRAYRTSSLASRQAQDDLVEDAAVRQQPHAVDESAAAEVGGAHACPEPAAGEQQSVIVGGPAAQGASAVTRLLVQEAGLSQQEAEKAVDRIVHYYVSSGGLRRNAPLLVSVSEVQPVVQALRQLPGLDLRRCLTRWPHILVGTPVARLELNRRQLEQRLEMTPAEVGRVATANPFLLREHLPDRCFPVLDYLAGLGFGVDRLRALFMRNPLAFNYGLAKMQERVKWLRKLGLTDAQLCLAIWKHLRILTITEHQSNAVAAWLSECGVPPDRIAAVVTRFPSLLGQSHKKRSAFLTYLRDDLGMDRDAIARLLTHVPDTVGRNLDVLRRNVEVMQTAVGFDLASLQRLVARNPGVLRVDLSSPTYTTKLRFVREVLQVAAADLPAFLVGQPFFIHYRLDRIATRAFFLKSLDILPLKSMSGWLASPETLFCTKYAKSSVGGYHAWQARWQESAEGRYWLQQASLRQRVMSSARLALESAPGSDSPEVVAALEAEAAASAEVAERLRAAQRLLRQGPGPGWDHLEGTAAQAAAQAQHGVQRADAAEQASRAALASIHERQAAAAQTAVAEQPVS